MSEAGLRSGVTLQALLEDPATSFALRKVISAWSTRNPVDALHDAECLAEALTCRLDAVLSCPD